MNAPARSGWLLATLLAGQVMANVDIAIVNVATPSIRHDMNASGGALEFVVSGYTLAFAMLLITGARLGDTHGHRRIFLLGLTGFTITSLACGLAPNIALLSTARVLQGASAAMLVPQIFTGIQQHFSGQARARALGMYAIALSASAVLGQALGGILISADLFGTGWRPIFLINLPIGIATLLTGLRVLPADQHDTTRRLDLPGMTALSTALLLLVVPLVFGRDEGWPVWSVVCLAAAVPAFAGFVLIERRVAAHGGYPLVNLAVLRIPAVTWGLPAQAAATGSYYTMLFALALYLQQGLGHSALYSGLALVSWVAAFGIAGPLLARLPVGLRPRFGPIGAGLLASAYLAICLLVASGHGDGAPLMTLLGLGGLGLGCMFSSVIGNMASSMPTRYAPDLSGINTTALQVAGTLSIAVFGTLYQGIAPNGGPQQATVAFTVVTAGFTGVAVLAVAFALRSIRHTATPPSAEVASVVGRPLGEGTAGLPGDLLDGVGNGGRMPH
jgi:MFS family permease